jgi:hypothetical protein
MAKEFSRPMLKIIVHENRVEIRDGLWPMVKKTIIPMKNIASVDVNAWTKELVIHTNDGKKHKYSIGGFGNAQACRDAIVEGL